MSKSGKTATGLTKLRAWGLVIFTPFRIGCCNMTRKAFTTVLDMIVNSVCEDCLYGDFNGDEGLLDAINRWNWDLKKIHVVNI